MQTKLIDLVREILAVLTAFVLGRSQQKSAEIAASAQRETQQAEQASETYRTNVSRSDSELADSLHGLYADRSKRRKR